MSKCNSKDNNTTIIAMNSNNDNGNNNDSNPNESDNNPINLNKNNNKNSNPSDTEDNKSANHKKIENIKDSKEIESDVGIVYKKPDLTSTKLLDSINLILKKCSQREIAEMNEYIRSLYPNISHQSVFPNGIKCGDYCLWQIRREGERRRRNY